MSRRTAPTASTTMDPPRAWTVLPEQGFVQGPLDLAFVAEQGFTLRLAAGQVGLVERDDAVALVLSAGDHDLRGIPADSRLYFLHVGRSIAWRWGSGAVLWTGHRDARTAVAVMGRCAVGIADPAAFHATFLRGTLACDLAHLQRVLDVLVRDRLEARLERTVKYGNVDPAAVQALLAHLRADDLADDLADYGLTCLELAVYTRQAPVSEASPSLAGHFAGPRDNSD